MSSRNTHAAEVAETVDTTAGLADESPFERRLRAFIDEHDPAMLGDRLAQRSALEVDVAWSRHDTPVGPLLLVVHDGVLVRVAFEREGFDDVIAAVSDRLGPRTLESPRTSDEVRRQLDEYFDGERHEFDVRSDLTLSSGDFRRRVQSALARIPYAGTASYAEVAATSGSPRAIRAVGSACSTNPLPIVLPCHRVVRSDGSFGQYLGGRDAKSFLLRHEKNYAPHQP